MDPQQTGVPHDSPLEGQVTVGLCLDHAWLCQALPIFLDPWQSAEVNFPVAPIAGDLLH